MLVNVYHSNYLIPNDELVPIETVADAHGLTTQERAEIARLLVARGSYVWLKRIRSSIRGVLLVRRH